MSKIQTGAWRTSAGEYKVFIRGCAQLEGTAVEVISRAGDSSYAVITGTHRKISGGYLYNFYRTGKPETTPSTTTTTITVDTPQTRIICAEVSINELDAALGLD
ncbi:hypothetical protein HZR23_05125 [Serpentinicella alkaliphila]|uniref:Uncharacterized protein n=1 Tax=Serpentinicella alkaliphila TaxID=1734049 RepID=A0A4R2UGY4_9FIRM|nr:hypothetical protein [Serpentinicella alkaliphila]QUH25203.1 hypothetical protein HZR23_05125 [Serpentinicella alkaliphila]TCQ07013.1 hypothetical protein EDD79_10029 [Serpentinicella alkaliphila]